MTTESWAWCWSGASGLSGTSLTLNRFPQEKNYLEMDAFSGSIISLQLSLWSLLTTVKHTESLSRHPSPEVMPLPFRDSSLPLFSSLRCCLQLPPPVLQHSLLHRQSAQQSGLQSVWSEHSVNQRVKNRKMTGVFFISSVYTCQRWSGWFLWLACVLVPGR